jgi:hypothetical protein
MNSISLNTKYDKNVRPAWTINKTIVQHARYVKQSCSYDKFAVSTLTFEPYYSDVDPTVYFVNQASIQSDLAGNREYENDFISYVSAIHQRLEEEFNNLHDNNKTIINVKITLTDLYINTTDSSEMCYKIATHLAFNKVMVDENLVAVL